MMVRDNRDCLPLDTGIIYGPVRSRRLGHSLGINLSPTRLKICSFDCVYCHFGWSSEVTSESAQFEKDYPDPALVAAALESYLQNQSAPDYITFSGTGEATMHPRFPIIVKQVLEVRDRLFPEVQVTILSNSTMAGSLQIQKALMLLDKRFMKLDCGDEETFQRFNRPAKDIRLERIVNNLKALKMPFIIQTMLAGGESGNYNRLSLEGYVEAIRQIQPQSVHLYSLDRPTPDGSLQGLSQRQLLDISEMLHSATGIAIDVFGPRIRFL